VILINGLVSNYDKLLAVGGLILEIHNGELFGFIGSNGRGKTTTKFLAGLLKPSFGTIHVDDMDIKQDPIRVKKSSATSLTEPFSITSKQGGNI
jgi:ABC-type multidrug transport system ATPase subunit